jgi:hypothetical protein
MNKYDRDSSEYKMTAACGISCANCECYTAKDNAQLMQYLIGRGIPAERLPCPGCRAVEGKCPVIGETCSTYVCSQQKGVDFCFECSDFPCDKLHPAADRANVLPHNLKVNNLCIIMNRGLTAFTEEAAAGKQKYYQGKMLVGRGPQIGE